MNRQVRRRQAQQAERQRRRDAQRGPSGGLPRWAGYGIAAAVAVVVLAVVGFLVYREATAVPPEKDDSAGLPGVFYPSQGNQHLQPNETYNGYNSNPPTSGPHAPTAQPPGIYREPIPKEVLVHSMEHGTVLVLYNCPQGCDDLRQQLEAIVQEYGEDGKLVLAAPYPDMDATIALVAWTRLDKFDEFDEGRIRRFIEVHERRYNPENF